MMNRCIGRLCRLEHRRAGDSLATCKSSESMLDRFALMSVRVRLVNKGTVWCTLMVRVLHLMLSSLTLKASLCIYPLPMKSRQWCCRDSLFGAPRATLLTRSVLNSTNSRFGTQCPVTKQIYLKAYSTSHSIESNPKSSFRTGSIGK